MKPPANGKVWQIQGDNKTPIFRYAAAPLAEQRPLGAPYLSPGLPNGVCAGRPTKAVGGANRPALIQTSKGVWRAP
jgi:hypothetical protein